ncbi:MAG: phytanoyl-CoA dioxygenase family protein [Gammaproteobacteria bacterium]|nr:phytanoyl-CoA dioxygenase family protein [Gammaproteobacteria bacterium]
MSYDDVLTLPSTHSATEHGVFVAPLIDSAALINFFDEQGYAVIRNVVSKEVCRHAIEAFNRDVKPDKRFFKRHESGTFERHVFTEAGFMKYPIMNIQDLSGRRLEAFRRAGLDVLTYRRLQDVLAALFGESGKIIHTMYFDGNQQTWPHRGSHYIDSEQIGRMAGVWVAAEDIHVGAGRFFVHARSHRADIPTDGQDPNGHDYKQKLAEFIDKHAAEFPRVAPTLQQGDVILWSSLTIHGSLATTTPEYSRRSFTAHYIPASHRYRWMQRFPGSDHNIVVNGVEITQHLDQMRWPLQLEHRLRADSPPLYKIYYLAKQTRRKLLQTISR